MLDCALAAAASLSAVLDSKQQHLLSLRLVLCVKYGHHVRGIPTADDDALSALSDALAGLLSLAFGPMTRRQQIEVAPVAHATPQQHGGEQDSQSAKPAIQRLEDRLLAELDRQHEGVQRELHEISALLEAALDAESLRLSELPLAAGAELSSHRLHPVPRRPSHLTEDREGELEIFVELEEQDPDESALWSHGSDMKEIGDLEDRLSGDVLAEGDRSSGEVYETSRDDSEVTDTDPSSDEGPAINRDNIQWFDWDDNDLV